MPGALRRILAIARKELLVLLGQPKSRFMVLLPPVLQIFVFAYAATMEVRNVDVLVRDADRGRWSTEIVNRLRGSTTFRHVFYTDDPAEVRRAVDERDVLCVLSFQNDFSARVDRGESAPVQVLLDGRRSNAAQIVNQYLTLMVRDVGMAAAQEQAGGAVRPVVVEPVNWFNPNLDFKWFILPNLIGMINFIMGIIITGLTVARERELGTFDQLLVSPAAPAEVAIGKIIPGCAVGLFHGTIFYIAARYFFQVPFTGSLLILYGAMFLFSLAVSSLGLMVSSITSTQQQAFLGSFAIVVPCVLLSGFMTPVNNMPHVLQMVSEVNPLRHFIVIAQGVFLKDISLAAALESGGRIAVIALINVTLAIWMFRRRV